MSSNRGGVIEFKFQQAKLFLPKDLANLKCLEVSLLRMLSMLYPRLSGLECNHINYPINHSEGTVNIIESGVMLNIFVFMKSYCYIL